MSKAGPISKLALLISRLAERLPASSDQLGRA